MNKNKPESQPQHGALNQRADSRGDSNVPVVDTITANRTPEPPPHPVLSCWDINRKLKRLQQDYGHDQNTKPGEIESSSLANPHCSAILWRVERLEQYADEIHSVYEKEIECGRFADTPDLWAAVYAQKILPSVSAKIGSLRWHLGHNLWNTGEARAGHGTTVEGEALRRLARLKAKLESELIEALKAITSASKPERNADAVSTSLPSGGTNCVWNGTDRSFADKILAEYHAKKFPANSPMDALRRASNHYVRKDGTKFNHRSLWQNLRNREAEGK